MPAKKTIGRKTKYSTQMRNNLCKWLKQGCTYNDACAIEGICYETFRVWKEEKPAFSAAIKKAETECKQKRIATIFKASEKSWQAAAWWLERRYREEYGRNPPQEERPNAVSYEEFEEADRLEEQKRCKTIEEARRKSSNAVMV